MPKRLIRPTSSLRGSEDVRDPTSARKRITARVLPREIVTSASFLTQAAQAAVKKKGSIFQSLFRRFLPRLTYQGAIWAIAHRIGRLVWLILHQGVRYVERGEQTTPKARKRRAQKLTQALRKLGYAVTLSPLNPNAQPAGHARCSADP